MATFPKNGRVVIAESIAARPLHVAWGLGDGAWTTNIPAENPDATGLINEIGRHTVTSTQYVVPDVNGTIVLPSGRFSPSVTPTNHLLISTTFDFDNASSSIIREVAIFAGTQVQAGLPVGQRYFTPSQITDPGKLLYVENIGPIYRSTAIQETFKTVITF